MTTLLSGSQFFRQEDTKRAITELSGEECRRLVIVVGAGAAAEAGLPTWKDLVYRLLTEAACTRVATGITEGRASELRDHILQGEGLVGAATIAEAALGDEFEKVLQRCLYHHPDDWRTGGPGPLCDAVAQVYKVFHNHKVDCAVATTNYDDFLVSSMRTALGSPVRQHVGVDEPTTTEHVVRHLHGCLGPTGPGEEVILTERHLIEATTAASWQQQYLVGRLRDSHVVFVGSSMADPNLRRFLHLAEVPQNRVFAVLARPVDRNRSPDVVAPRSETLVAAEELAKTRWKAMGVKVLYADYYSQVTQFLHEVAFRRQYPSAPPYGERVDEWYRRFSVLIGFHEREEFEAAQTFYRATLETWIYQVRQLLSSLDIPVDEDFAIHVWFRTPSGLGFGPPPPGPVNLTSLAMGICSDREWSHPGAIDRRAIMLPTRRCAIEAFCYGRFRIHAFQVDQHQWNFVLGVPIVLDIDDPDVGRLPVGALTLNSARPLGSSAVDQLRSKSWQDFVELAELLSLMGSDLLNPGGKRADALFSAR